MIEIKNVTKTFDGFTALHDVSLTVPAGSVYGLVGPNGAGKSTLIRCLTGIYRPDTGTLKADGQEVWENAELKSRIAAIPDDWYYLNVLSSAKINVSNISKNPTASTSCSLTLVQVPTNCDSYCEEQENNIILANNANKMLEDFFTIST